MLGALFSALAGAGMVTAAPIRNAKPDSLRPPGFLNAINFHPSYSTGYSVNRTSRAWDQSLNYARRVGVFDLTNSWSVGLRKDKNQNDLRAKRGEMKFGLNYLLKEYGDWTVGLDGEFRRDGSFSTYKGTPPPINRRDQVENKSDFGLSVASRLPNGAMHRLVPFLREFNLTTSASSGLSSDRSVSRRQKLLDSTRVTGIFRHYDVALDGNVRAFRMSTRLMTDRSTGDSETRQRDVLTGGINNDSKESTDNRRKNLQGSLDYSRGEVLRANVQGHLNDETNQYWDIQANNSNGGQESKVGEDHGVGASFDWNPRKDATLHGDYTRQDLQANYKLQVRDFFKRTDSEKINGRLKIPSFLLLLSGLEIESSLQLDESKNVLEETADFRQTNRRLRNVLRRQLGTKVQVQATNELSLLQYFYDDKSNDRDEQRVFTDGILLYNPSTMFNEFCSRSQGERKRGNYFFLLTT